jgi:hypothetical protein
MLIIFYETIKNINFVRDSAGVHMIHAQNFFVPYNH